MSENDNQEEIQVNLPDDVLFELMLLAHERDITLNQLVTNILRTELAQEQTNEHRD